MPILTITEVQRQQFATDGYLITDVVFDEPTLAGVRRAFERMWDEDIAQAKKTGDSLAQDWAKFRPHMSQLDHRDAACRAFCHHPVFGELCRQLLGPAADLSWNQAIVKAPMPPGSRGNPAVWDNVFAWHQDLWYALNGPYVQDCHPDLLTAPDNAITCWVAVTRTTVDNGTLWVLPGRHREGLVHHNWHAGRREWQAQVDPTFRIPVVLRAGQVLVFQKYLPHSSGTNLSDEVRMAYQIGYTVPGLNRVPSPNFSPVLRNSQLV